MWEIPIFRFSLQMVVYPVKYLNRKKFKKDGFEKRADFFDLASPWTLVDGSHYEEANSSIFFVCFSSLTFFPRHYFTHYLPPLPRLFVHTNNIVNGYTCFRDIRRNDYLATPMRGMRKDGPLVDGSHGGVQGDDEVVVGVGKPGIPP